MKIGKTIPWIGHSQQSYPKTLRKVVKVPLDGLPLKCPIYIRLLVSAVGRVWGLGLFFRNFSLPHFIDKNVTCPGI